jgi:Apea-like HEPN
VNSTDRQILGECLDRIVNEGLAAMKRGEQVVVFKPHIEMHDSGGITHSSILDVDTNILVRRCMNNIPLTMPVVVKATRALATAAGGAWAEELEKRTPEHYGGSRAFEALMGLAARILTNCVEGAARDGHTAGAIEYFERFCELPRVTWTITVLLLGVTVTNGPHSASDRVVIRAADNELKQTLWTSHGPGIHPFGRLDDALALAGANAVLETTIPTERDGWLPYAEANDLIAPVVTALRVHGARHLVELVEWIHGPPEIEGLSKAPISTVRVAQDTQKPQPPDALTMDSVRAHEVQTWIAQYQQRTADDALSFAIQRFNLCDERKSNEDRLVDAWIALESLLSLKGQTEISYRIALRLATLLGGSGLARKETRDLAKASYNVRSDIVHGTPPAKRKTKPVDEVARETEELLRKTLRLWILEAYKTPKDVIDQLDDRLVEGVPTTDASST